MKANYFHMSLALCGGQESIAYNFCFQFLSGIGITPDSYIAPVKDAVWCLLLLLNYNDFTH